jgi:hypothetical protein
MFLIVAFANIIESITLKIIVTFPQNCLHFKINGSSVSLKIQVRKFAHVINNVWPVALAKKVSNYLMHHNTI